MMSFKEQAQTLFNKIALIAGKIHEVQQLCNLVLMETKVNGEVIQLSNEKKQTIMQAYQTKKAELKALVEALP